MLAIAPECDIEVERGPGWLLVRIKHLDPEDTEFSLAEHLWNVLEQHFTYRLVLELDEVPRLNIRHIEQLIELRRRMEKRGGLLRICGLSPHNCRLLRTCESEEQLLPYEDRQEAVMGHPHFRRPR